MMRTMVLIHARGVLFVFRAPFKVQVQGQLQWLRSREFKCRFPRCRCSPHLIPCYAGPFLLSRSAQCAPTSHATHPAHPARPAQASKWGHPDGTPLSDVMVIASGLSGPCPPGLDHGPPPFRPRAPLGGAVQTALFGLPRDDSQARAWDPHRARSPQRYSYYSYNTYNTYYTSTI